MIELFNINSIIEYDETLEDTLSDLLAEKGIHLEYSKDIERKVSCGYYFLNCKASKDFSEVFNLRDLRPIFISGAIRVKAEDGQVMVELESKNAKVHSWTINRIYLDQGSYGIAHYIDTEDEVELWSAVSKNCDFIKVEPLVTSNFYGRDICRDDVTVNKKFITHTITMNFYDWLEMKESK